MGLKGNLSTVNLADVFQILIRGNSTGLLRIQAPDGPHFVEIQNGAISIAGRSVGRIMLGDLLVSRGLIDETHLAEALKKQKETGKLLGQMLEEMGLVTMQQLEEALRFQIDEEVCELFNLKSGDFTFLDAATLDAQIAPGGGLVRFKIDPNSLLLEAARRADEWKAVEQRITSQALLFELTAQGKAALQTSEGISPEGLVLLRLALMHRTVETMVVKACLGRVNTNQMLLELWDAGLIEPLPFSAYPALARQHLGLNRAEEARRIAQLALECGTDEEKSEARAVIKCIDRSAEGVSGNTPVEQRRPTEVIRRPPPANLFKKKERTLWPYAVGLLVILAAGTGALFMFKQNDNSNGVRRLDEIKTIASQYMMDGKYTEALELLQDFKSSDEKIQKLAKEYLDARQHEVDLKVQGAVQRFQADIAADKAEDLKLAAVELERLADVHVVNADVEIQRISASAALQDYRGNQRLGEAQARLKAIETTEKAKGLEALQKAYETFLMDNPPEEVAAAARDQLGSIESVLNAGSRALKKAGTLEIAGFEENARQKYEQIKVTCPNSALSAEAEKNLVELERKHAAAQGQVDKIEGLQKQQKSEEARVALIAFLESAPPQELRQRALKAMDGKFQEAEAQALLASAQNATPAVSRQKIIELAEKFPFSKSAARVTLKVRINTLPENADVILNGTSSGKTPLDLDMPVLGPSLVLLSKTGYETEEQILNNSSGENLEVVLNRLPQLTRRIPAPAHAGMLVAAEQVVLGGGAQLVVCSRDDLKVLKRVNLMDSLKAQAELIPLSLSNGQGQIFVESQKSGLFRFSVFNGALSRISLLQPATSQVALFKSPSEDAKWLIGLATRNGFECYDFEHGNLAKNLLFDGETQGGAASDTECLYVPQGKLLNAVIGYSAEKKWSVSMDAVISGAPAYFAAKSTVACVDAMGKITLWNKESKTELHTKLGEQNLSGTCRFGCQSIVGGFLVVIKDQKGIVSIALIDPATAAFIWTSKLPGDAILPAVAIRTSAKETDIGIALCMGDGEKYWLSVLNPANGTLLWSSHLPAKAVAMATDGQFIYVSTEDARLSAYNVK